MTQDIRLIPKPDKTRAIIVDLDGTLALRNGRGPYEFDKVFDDLLNIPVAQVIDGMIAQDITIIFTTGRPMRAYKDTDAWLTSHGLGHFELYMRPDNDYRKDHIVKEEIYRTFIEPHYDISFVLDDRNTVVEMWRRLGLTCLQVASGDF